MHSVKAILAATIATLALAAPPAQRDAGHQNCLADVIHARGIEMKGLERRASWSYEGKSGVSHWGEFGTTCEKGEYQSPINFEALLSHEVNGIDYAVQQVHFHSPSEHHVDEKYFPLEAHFVHASADGKLNVIGVFFEIGTENPWIAQFVDNIPLTTNATTQIPSLDLSSIISALGASKFYSYSGSLTTPPCTEGVLWLVAQEPLKISKPQLDKLRKAMPFNSRTTQANKSGENDEANHETKNESGTTSSNNEVAPAKPISYSALPVALIAGGVVLGVVGFTAFLGIMTRRVRKAPEELGSEACDSVDKVHEMEGFLAASL
ncbi:UNVERIFIED_CONTAM: hypothetical protein HDU68_009499 [Siphonaria sp. JEL0065]|nr:hypothetical protein HDU68_009499 [Siphonaria sp. JEL0065]